MSGVLNDCDALLQAASVRILNPKDAFIYLTPSAPGFHLNSAGVADLSVVTVTADLIALDGDIVFSGQGVTLSNVKARSVDANYVSGTGIVTATVATNGDTFSRSLVIPVLRDGASTPGVRGAGHYYVTGSTWSDIAAQAACPGGPVVNDVVTISSGTFVGEKRWTGSAWIDNGVVINGKLIVPDSILATSIDARGLAIKDAQGNVILGAGSALAAGFEAPGTKNSEQQWSDVQGIPYQSILNNDDSVALGFNPTLSDWPTGSIRPTGWSGHTPVRDTTIKRLGQWSARFDTNGTAQYNLNRKVSVPTLPLGTFIAGTCDIYIDSINAANTTGKPGLMVRLWWGTGTGEYTDRDFPAQQVVKQWQRINFTARPAAGKQIVAIEFYLFGSFSRVTFGGHFYGSVAFDNFRFALYDNSLDNTAISLGADGKLGGAGGGQVTITGLGYTGELDATKGAPAGTTVGGTEAGLLATRALNGDSAYNAVNNATTGLAAKLNASAASTLKGRIAVSVGGGMAVGTLDWDPNTGARTGGYGLAITPAGILGYAPNSVAYPNGRATFYINAATGDTMFGGTLEAPSGTLGNLHIAAGGAIHGGAYTSWSSWLAGGGDGFFMDSSVYAAGNYAAGKYVIIYATGTVFMPGFRLENGQLTLTNPIIIGADLGSFTASLSGAGMTSSGANGARALGSRQIIGSGGKLPYRSYLWVVSDLEGNPAARTTISNETTDTVSVSASGTNASTRVRITGIITDANGITASASFISTANFGTV